jgi:serine/threonine protein kinase
MVSNATTKDTHLCSGQNFEKEMEIMKKLNHPNLVKMYGICVDEFPFFIVQVTFRS